MKPSPVWRPFTSLGSVLPPLKISEAKGPFLYDEHGKPYLDGISSWWVITHGHCRPEIVAAIRQQSEKLDQVIFANFTHEPGEELAEKILDLAGAPFSRVFYSDNGSTAVEVAMKMAVQAFHNRGESRSKFIAFSEAYHGDTVGAMSVGADGMYTDPFQSMRFQVLRAPQARYSTDSFASHLGAYKKLLQDHHKQVAAVILEPFIQGAAGMIVWPKDAVEQIVGLAHKYGAYVIFDEVFVGFGRTGKMFAMDHLQEKPDLVCLSKGLTGGFLPLAMTLATESIYECFLSSEKAKTFFHGHSFTGNPVACAAALANLQIFSTEDVLGRVSDLAHVHSEAIAKIPRKGIRDIRHLGVVAALEFDDAGGVTRAQNICRELLKKGIFLRPLGSVIYWIPPYDTPPHVLQEAWEVLTSAISQGEEALFS